MEANEATKAKLEFGGIESRGMSALLIGAAPQFEVRRTRTCELSLFLRF
jgi:hypothetical protein